MTDQFSAHDPAIGYLYQIKYALWLLLQAGIDGQQIEIAIERLDDIDIKKNGSEFQVIQTKHHRNLNFLTNSSTDLWKTMRIWCDAFQKKKFQVENVILTIVTTGISPDESIASMLRPSPLGCRDIKTAVEKLVGVANISKNETNQPAYTIFKSLSREEQIILVDKIQVLDASPNILDLREKIINILTYTASRKYIEAVYEQITGWWHDLVIDHLYKKSSEYIDHRLLRNAIDDIREQFSKESLPIHFPNPIQIHENDLDKDQRIFIEQLRLVQIGQKRTNHALSDFYTSSMQRSKWIREFLISINELEFYDNKLYNEWERIFAVMEEEVDEGMEEDEIIKKGRDFYTNIMKLNFHIRSRCTEEFITRGSYHILANQLRLGWHIQFYDRLNHLFFHKE